ncbi:MAG: bifunctional adenosylcobinamide kinase/adenosylcobinamide-phosphate guanylyltransferase [Clostridiales bacterium]|nr:bifunctional adenosylcobinamide kinase/adenosylcobinamide-phosphate guanylyltransferase [Clostridiales bacterium]
MMTLVSGGAGSGKSAYAESLILQSSAAPRIYLATMQAWGEEGRQRVERHRRLRAGKGFLTVEQPLNLTEVEIPQGSAVLLEDLSNLTANECFGGAGFAGAEERILTGVDSIRAQAGELVIVTNEIFSDGVTYPPETAQYLDILARLNRQLAAQADRVVEVAAGIPIFWKGENP